MAGSTKRSWLVHLGLAGLALGVPPGVPRTCLAQDLPPGFLGGPTPAKKPLEAPGAPALRTSANAPVEVSPAQPEDADRPLPISLATALQLASARPLDIAVARERVRVAVAQLDRARVLWLPTVYVGGDYVRHDGRIQDTSGNILDVGRQSLMAGAGPSAVFALADAYFAPLAARQVVAARQAGVQAAANDSLLAVAEAYFTVQQARGELAGAEDAARRAADLARRAEQLADAEAGLKDAVDTAERSFEGLGQTKRAGNLVLLVVRPQEAVAAVQSLALAYGDYYEALGDYNRAQFHLYRALGQPAQLVLGSGCEPAARGQEPGVRGQESGVRGPN
jgi:hypothetical protein